MEEKNIEVVKSYFRLVNEEKFDEFFNLFDPDVEFKAPYNFQTKGLENIKPFYLRVPADYPEHVDTPECILASGDRVAVYIDFVGKSKKGQSVCFKATDWFQIENGKIKSLNIFYDSYGVLADLKKKKDN